MPERGFDPLEPLKKDIDRINKALINSLEINKRFGERVAYLRKSRGLSQEQLADKAHLHRTYIGGIERGERNLTLINIVRVANGLGVPPWTLLFELEKRGGRR